MLDSRPELSIIMPCLNEARTLPVCLQKAKDFLAQNKVNGEIVIADNGSDDGSRDLARMYGARVVEIAEKGYGAALQGGIAAAQGRYVIMGDADDSYDFLALMPILEKLREGYDLVLGNRFRGGIKDGAMPLLNRYLGNPVLTFIGKLFFHVPLNDFHCGLRGFSRQAILDLDLRTTGMEYASEMIVRAALRKLKMTEVPVTLSPDGRGRPPHLHPWRDGWRHLRFLLIYSPRWMYLYPGLLLVAMGLFGAIVLLPGPKTIADGIELDVNTLLISSMAVLVGVQSLTFGLIARYYALQKGILPNPRYEKIMAGLTLERLLVFGGILIALGLSGVGWAAHLWYARDFGPLVHRQVIRILIVSVTGIAAGLQIGFSAFMLGVMQIKHR